MATFDEILNRELDGGKFGNTFAESANAELNAIEQSPDYQNFGDSSQQLLNEELGESVIDYSGYIPNTGLSSPEYQNDRQVSDQYFQDEKQYEDTSSMGRFMNSVGNLSNDVFGTEFDTTEVHNGKKYMSNNKDFNEESLSQIRNEFNNLQEDPYGSQTLYYMRVVNDDGSVSYKTGIAEAGAVDRYKDQGLNNGTTILYDKRLSDADAMEAKIHGNANALKYRRNDLYQNRDEFGGGYTELYNYDILGLDGSTSQQKINQLHMSTRDKWAEMGIGLPTNRYDEKAYTTARQAIRKRRELFGDKDQQAERMQGDLERAEGEGVGYGNRLLNAVDAFQSASQQLVAGVGDTILDAVTPGDNTLLNNLKSAETANKFWGYDPRESEHTMGKSLQDWKDGNYAKAAFGALTNPEVLGQSLPEMGLMFTPMGAGRTVIGKALTTANKIADPVKKAAAIKKATDTASLGQKAAYQIADNGGFLAVSAKQTNNQVDERTKNNDGVAPNLVEIGAMFAANTAALALDKVAFKNIIKGGKIDELKKVVNSLDDAGLQKIAKGVAIEAAAITKAGGTEFGQEYMQQWAEILNQQLGTAKHGTDVWTAENFNQALSAGIAGLGAGVQMHGAGTAGKYAMEELGAFEESTRSNQDAAAQEQADNLNTTVDKEPMEARASAFEGMPRNAEGNVDMSQMTDADMKKDFINKSKEFATEDKIIVESEFEDANDAASGLIDQGMQEAEGGPAQMNMFKMAESILQKVSESYETLNENTKVGEQTIQDAANNESTQKDVLNSIGLSTNEQRVSTETLNTLASSGLGTETEVSARVEATAQVNQGVRELEADAKEIIPETDSSNEMGSSSKFTGKSGDEKIAIVTDQIFNGDTASKFPGIIPQAKLAMAFLSQGKKSKAETVVKQMEHLLTLQKNKLKEGYENPADPKGKNLQHIPTMIVAMNESIKATEQMINTLNTSIAGYEANVKKYGVEGAKNKQQGKEPGEYKAPDKTEVTLDEHISEAQARLTKSENFYADLQKMIADNESLSPAQHRNYNELPARIREQKAKLDVLQQQKSKEAPVEPEITPEPSKEAEPEPVVEEAPIEPVEPKGVEETSKEEDAKNREGEKSTPSNDTEVDTRTKKQKEQDAVAATGQFDFDAEPETESKTESESKPKKPKKMPDNRKPAVEYTTEAGEQKRINRKDFASLVAINNKLKKGNPLNEKQKALREEHVEYFDEHRDDFINQNNYDDMVTSTQIYEEGPKYTDEEIAELDKRAEENAAATPLQSQAEVTQGEAGVSQSELDASQSSIENALDEQAAISEGFDFDEGYEDYLNNMDQNSNREETSAVDQDNTIKEIEKPESQIDFEADVEFTPEQEEAMISQESSGARAMETMDETAPTRVSKLYAPKKVDIDNPLPMDVLTSFIDPDALILYNQTIAEDENLDPVSEESIIAAEMYKEQYEQFKAKLLEVVRLTYMNGDKNKIGDDTILQSHALGLFTLNDDGTYSIDDAVANVMFTETMGHIKDSANYLTHNDADNINRMVGDPKKTTPSPAAWDILGEAGILRTFFADSLGKRIKTLIPIVANRQDTDVVDPTLMEKLSLGLAQLSMDTLKQMDYLEYTELPEGKTLADYKEVKINREGGEYISERYEAGSTTESMNTGEQGDNGKIIFVRFTREADPDIEGQTRVTQKSKNMEQEAKWFADDLVLINDTKKESIAFTFEPENISEASHETTQQKNSPEFISEKQAKNVNEMQKQEYNLYEAAHMALDFGEKFMKAAQGYVFGVEQTVHEDNRKSVDSSNLGIETTIIDLTTLQAKQNTRREEGKDTGFFYKFGVMKNNRIHMISNMLNAQSDAGGARFYIGLNSNKKNVDIEGKTQESRDAAISFKTAIVQGLNQWAGKGKGEDKNSYMTNMNSFEKIRKTKAVKDAIEVINNYIPGDEKTKNEDNQKIMLEAINGHGAHSMLALYELAKYERMLADGKTNFETQMPMETDAVTSGVMLTLMQLPILGPATYQWLNKGGMFFKGQQVRSMGTWLENAANYDSYQTIALSVGENLNRILDYDRNQFKQAAEDKLTKHESKVVTTKKVPKTENLKYIEEDGHTYIFRSGIIVEYIPNESGKNLFKPVFAGGIDWQNEMFANIDKNGKNKDFIVGYTGGHSKGQKTITYQPTEAEVTAEANKMKKSYNDKQAIIENMAGKLTEEVTENGETKTVVTGPGRLFAKYPLMTFFYGSGVENIIGSVVNNITDKNKKLLEDIKAADKPADKKKLTDEYMHRVETFMPDASASAIRASIVQDPLAVNTYALDNSMKESIHDTYGVALQQSMESIFGNIVAIRKLTNKTNALMFEMFENQLENKINAYIDTHGMEPSNQQIQEMVAGMTGVRPRFETTQGHATMLKEGVDADTYDKQNNVVQTATREGNKDTSITTRNIRRKYMINAAGSPVIIIHSHDSAIEMEVPLKFASLQVFDANVLNVNDTFPGTQLYNKTTNDKSIAFSMIDSVKNASDNLSKTFDNMIKNGESNFSNKEIAELYHDIYMNQLQVEKSYDYIKDAKSNMFSTLDYVEHAVMSGEESNPGGVLVENAPQGYKYDKDYNFGEYMDLQEIFKDMEEDPSNKPGSYSFTPETNKNISRDILKSLGEKLNKKTNFVQMEGVVGYDNKWNVVKNLRHAKYYAFKGTSHGKDRVYAIVNKYTKQSTTIKGRYALKQAKTFFENKEGQNTAIVKRSQPPGSTEVSNEYEQSLAKKTEGTIAEGTPVPYQTKIDTGNGKPVVWEQKEVSQMDKKGPDRPVEPSSPVSVRKVWSYDNHSEEQADRMAYDIVEVNFNDGKGWIAEDPNGEPLISIRKTGKNVSAQDVDMHAYATDRSEYTQARDKDGHVGRFIVVDKKYEKHNDDELSLYNQSRKKQNAAGVVENTKPNPDATKPENNLKSSENSSDILSEGVDKQLTASNIIAFAKSMVTWDNAIDENINFYLNQLQEIVVPSLKRTQKITLSRGKAAGDLNWGNLRYDNDGEANWLSLYVSQKQAEAAVPEPQVGQTMIEIYTHELMHAVSAYILNGENSNFQARRRIKQFFDTARANVTFEDFLNRDADGNFVFQVDKEREILEAKRMYNYVFHNKEGKGLEEFIAYALSNKNLAAKLGTIKPEGAKATGTGLMNKIMAFITQILEKMLNRDMYKNKNDIHSALGSLVVSMNSTHHNRANFLVKMLQVSARQFRKANIMTNSKTEAFFGKDGIDVKNINNKAKKAIAHAYNVAISPVIKTEAGQKLREVYRKSGILDERGLLFNLYNTILTDGKDMKEFTALGLKSQSEIDRKRESQVAAQIELLHKAFGRELTQEENQTLQLIGLETDVSYLLDKNFDIAQIKKLFDDPVALNTAIKDLNNRLRILPEGKTMVAQTQALGNYMATGETTIHGQLMNAHMIAKHVLSDNPIDSADVSENTEYLINTMATLISIQKSSPSMNKTFSNMLSTDSAAMITFMKQHIAYKKDSLERNFAGNQDLMVKGYTMGAYNQSIVMEVGPYDALTESLKQKEGFKVDHTFKDPLTNEKLAVYVSGEGSRGSYNPGMIPRKETNARGESVRKVLLRKHDGNWKAANAELNTLIKREKDLRGKKPYGNPRVAPVFNLQGEIVDLRYMMPKMDKNRILHRDDNGIKTLGKMNGAVEEKANQKPIFKAVAQLLADDKAEHFAKEPGAFVWIGEPGKNEKNRTTQEFKEMYRHIPENMQHEIRKQFKEDGFWIRKKAIRAIIGERDASLANAKVFDHELFKNMPQVRKYIRQAEQYWKKLVGMAKKGIVIKTPEVLITNMVSNSMALVQNGMDPDQVFKVQAEGITATLEYIKDHGELTQLKLQSRAGKTGLDPRIKELERELEANPMSYLIEEGFMQSIIEDVDVKKHRYVDQYDKDVFQKMDDKYQEKTPDVLKTLAELAMMGDKTAFFKMMLQATQYSDLVSRYAYDKISKENHARNVKEKLSNKKKQLDRAGVDKYAQVAILAEEKAKLDEEFRAHRVINLANAFINYAELDHWLLKYGSDMGLLMFYKFLVGIQRVVRKMVREQPVTVAALIALQMMVGDAEDPLDSTLFMETDLMSRIKLNPFDHIESAWTPYGLKMFKDAIDAVDG